MQPTRSDRAASFLRCFAIQGSWNYRSVVAGGLVNALLPMLRRIYAGDPVRLRDAVERHLKPFNGHPYLCPMAVTALARLEHDGESPERIDRFRNALRAPLGAVGDELVWAAWRPFCALAAILVFWVSERPWLAVWAFLLMYNAGHFTLRAWAFRRGWTAGLRVGKVLNDPPWGRAVSWLTGLNLLLVGCTVALVAWLVDPNAFGRWGLLLGVAGALLLGYARPRFGERAAALLVLIAPIALILFGV